MSQPAPVPPTPWSTRLIGTVRSLGQGLIDLLFPRICWACSISMPGETAAFCKSCHAGLTSDPNATCPFCAASVGPHANTANGCLKCRNEHFAFTAVVRLGPYESLLQEVILRLKHQSGEGLAEVLGELFAVHAENRLRALAPDLIVPIPLHWYRRWRRGYNQSEALALALADRLRLPCLPHGLHRWRNTPMQHHQSSPTARRLNVKDAFRMAPRTSFKDRSVLLVDDVLTTGSTINEAARILKAAGAARVVVAVLARAGN